MVFSKDRPRGRLAHEYKQLVREISTRNWNDRDGALEYIQRAEEPRRWSEEDSIVTRDEKLARIEQVHRDDGEILFSLAELRESDDQPESTALLVNQAIHHGYDRPKAFLKRSRFRADNDELDGAVEDAWSVLESEYIAPPMVREAVGRLARLEVCEPQRFVKSNAVASLDLNGKFWLASSFNRPREDLLIAVPCWEQIVASPDTQPDMRESARHNLGLSYMDLGRCAEAAKCFCDATCDISSIKIVEAFNYGMAIWGTNGTIDSKRFELVVELDQSDEGKEKTANYLECMAIAYWAVGATVEAIDRVIRAQRSLNTLRGRTEFSCWRYLQVSMSTFRVDLDEIQTMIEKNEPGTPRFMAVSDTTTFD